MIILITRHGQCISNLKKDYYFNCGIDDELTSLGKKQAKKTGECLAHENIDVIFSSFSKRTAMTGEIIKSCLNNNPPMVFDKLLREAEFGIFDSKSIGYIIKNYKKIYSEREKNKFSYKMPGGESYEEVYSRVIKFLLSLKEKYNGKTVLIVTHATTIKLFLLALSGMTLKKIESFYYYNTSIFKFEVSFFEKKLSSTKKKFNQKDHLFGIENE